MKTLLRRNRMRTAIAVISFSIVAAPGAKAACTAHNGGTLAPSLESLRNLAVPDLGDALDQAGPFEADNGTSESKVTVVGLWKKIWFAGGVLNDIGFAHFNEGGTELINDVGAFNLGNNYCLGAWKQIGSRTYELVHPFFVFDESGKNAIGVAIEKSHLTVSRDGNSFRGTWTQDNYDFSGKLVPGNHFDGPVIGTRITPGASFPFPFPF